MTDADESERDAAMAWARRVFEELRSGSGRLSPTTQAEVAQLAALVGHAEPIEADMEAKSIRRRSPSPLVLAVAQMEAYQQNDLVGMDRLAARARAQSERTVPRSVSEVQAQLIAAAMTTLAAGARADSSTLQAQVVLLASLREELPAADPDAADVRAQIDRLLESIAAIDPAQASGGSSPGEHHEALLAPLRDRVARTGDQPALQAVAYARLGAAAMTIAEEGGPDHYLDECAHAFGEGVRLNGDDDPWQVAFLTGWGKSLVLRFERTGDRRYLDEAIAAMDRARSLAVDAAHPHWAFLCTYHSLAHRYARRHDVADAIGRDGLQGHAWSAMLQADAAAATSAARHAATDAMFQARWAFDAGDVEGGIAALESGRGLALAAATRIADASTVLRAAGADDLAARWDDAVGRQGADHVPIELRREVVRAIEHAVGAGPVPSQTVADTQDALVRLGGDAAIYLIAGDDDQGDGYAVVVPARGGPTVCPLPGLALVPGGPLDRYLAENSARGDDTSRTRLGASWASALAQLCEWAWTAAVGPLLDHLGTGPRPLRLALIAMGELGVVPWHAANSVEAGRVTYAVERAVFSSAVSARMLREAACTASVPIGTGGLVIGDPDTGGTDSPLLAARREALAVWSVFYPDAVYLGRTAEGATAPGGAGTRDELEKWLADPRPEQGAVLHAACHGIVRRGPEREPSSLLLLADGDYLAAEDLVGALVGSGRGLALVSLSACDTGVSGRGYDEAFSLATAFLNGGAATVVSSLWSLPDSATATLMFMFHHFLRAEALPPADALRAAQLWMLRPDRAMPPAMPRALRRSLQLGVPADVIAWAGVHHAGR